MDAHQQQDALVHLHDGVMNHLINEASFVTSSELTFTYVFDISLNQESSYCHDNETWNEMEAKRSLIMPSSKNSILNLLQKLNVLIAQAVLGDKTELQNRERSFVSLQVINQ